MDLKEPLGLSNHTEALNGTSPKVFPTFDRPLCAGSIRRDTELAWHDFHSPAAVFSLPISHYPAHSHRRCRCDPRLSWPRALYQHLSGRLKSYVSILGKLLFLEVHILDISDAVGLNIEHSFAARSNILEPECHASRIHVLSSRVAPPNNKSCLSGLLFDNTVKLVRYGVEDYL